jgi:hypothetical protein
MKTETVVQLEERTARLTILIDPRKKAVFEKLCAQEDLTPSQVVRRMIRGYIEQRLGRPWVPGNVEVGAEAGPMRGSPKRRAPRS